MHEYVPEEFLTERGLTNYWGYNTIGFFAPHQGYSAAVRGRARARRPGQRVQGHGQGAAPGGHRGHPRRGLQPHRGGQRERAHAELPRPGQRHVLPAGGRRREQVLRHHGHRQLAERGQPVHAAADHGQPPVLDVGDARRRVPVRPGRHPRPGGGQPLRPVLRLLRAGRAGPGDRPGEADRRAVGRRPVRQLRPGPVPRGVAGVERQVPGLRCATSGGRGTSASPSSPPGSAGRPTCTARRAAARPPR